MDDMIERISRLEASMENLVKSQIRMEEALTKMADTMSDLAAIREGHSRHSDEIALLRQRYHDLADVAQQVPFLKEKIDRQEFRLDQVEPKIEDLEKMSAIGGIANKWFFWLVMGGLMFAIQFLVKHI